MSQHRKVVHIHIPKCGGTAVTKYLRRLLGRENVAHFGHRGQTAQFRSMPPEALSHYLAIGGHIPYQLLLDKLGSAPKYFTVVREPFDLFVSYYRDVARRSTHPLHQEASAMSPTDFVEVVTSKGYLKPQLTFISRDASLEEAQCLIRNGVIRAEPLTRIRRLMVEIARDFGRDPISFKQTNKSLKFNIKDKKSVRSAVGSYFAADFALYRCVLEKSQELALTCMESAGEND